MNPSASGWIKKVLNHLKDHQTYLKDDDPTFYTSLKASGFIYGSNVMLLEQSIEAPDLTEEEIGKANLLLALKYVHNKHAKNTNFVFSVIDFYKAINAHKVSIFEELLGYKKSASLLEKIINKRVHIDDNIIAKSFNNFVINALLFIDILAYQTFLKTGHISFSYIENIEATIDCIVCKVIASKPQKTKYDYGLIKLFESSLRYHDNTKTTYSDVIKHISLDLEKQYLVDIVCMASWTDKLIDQRELQLLHQLQRDLGLPQEIIKTSVDDINAFYSNHKDKITFLNSKNLIQSFYDNSSQLVNKLIKRNRKRLLRELNESKEVMQLLSQSTYRKLTDDEQKQIQNQLLDIFKTIPSLAIFMLPGGMLLLPLFIKFIPKLLPSAFDDNRIEEKQN